MTFKVRQLAPDLPNTTLGILGFIGLLVAMAVQPIVGVFSDRAKTKLGRRLPFIVGGAVLIAASLFLLALAPTLWVLLLGVIFIQFSSNILQGPWQALIPDLVPEGQRGTASSLKAVMDIIATVVAGAVAGILLGTTGQKLFGEFRHLCHRGCTGDCVHLIRHDHRDLGTRTAGSHQRGDRLAFNGRGA